MALVGGGSRSRKRAGRGANPGGAHNAAAVRKVRTFTSRAVKASSKAAGAARTKRCSPAITAITEAYLRLGQAQEAGRGLMSGREQARMRAARADVIRVSKKVKAVCHFGGK